MSIKQEFEMFIKSLKNMAITKIPLVGSHRWDFGVSRYDEFMRKKIVLL